MNVETILHSFIQLLFIDCLAHSFVHAVLYGLLGRYSSEPTKQKSLSSWWTEGNKSKLSK